MCPLTFHDLPSWKYRVRVGLALRCTNCAAASVSSLFYLGAGAHICRHCGAPFDLADPALDRRKGGDRRDRDGEDAFADVDRRTGFDRRYAQTG